MQISHHPDTCEIISNEVLQILADAVFEKTGRKPLPDSVTFNAYHGNKKMIVTFTLQDPEIK